MSNQNSIVVMYGLTPCHAGSGSAMGVVDLPIQRERHTNWPVIQASGVKGAFRANFEKFRNRIPENDKNRIKDFENITKSIFGSSDDTGYAGSFSISDAKILAYPMRSNIAPFVWITCPSVLKRLIKDLKFIGKPTTEFDWTNVELELNKNISFVLSKKDNKDLLFEGDKGVLIEDYQVSINKNNDPVSGLTEIILKYLEKAERLLLVSDEIFNYGVTDCTQVSAKISIDSKTGTTMERSLRYQEELPSDTIMYSIICWGDSKNTVEENLKAETIKKFICEEVIANYIQIAGDETLGRGIFELSWI